MNKRKNDKDGRAQARENAILALDLRDLMIRKCRRLGLVCPVGDRASVVCQVLISDRPRLFLYEAGFRETLFPRFVWELEQYSGSGYGSAIRDALRMERANPKAVRAHRDTRPAASCVCFGQKEHARPLEQSAP